MSRHGAHDDRSHRYTQRHQQRPDTQVLASLLLEERFSHDSRANGTRRGDEEGSNESTRHHGSVRGAHGAANVAREGANQREHPNGATAITCRDWVPDEGRETEGEALDGGDVRALVKRLAQGRCNGRVGWSDGAGVEGRGRSHESNQHDVERFLQDYTRSVQHTGGMRVCGISHLPLRPVQGILIRWIRHRVQVERAMPSEQILSRILRQSNRLRIRPFNLQRATLDLARLVEHVHFATGLHIRTRLGRAERRTEETYFTRDKVVREGEGDSYQRRQRTLGAR